MGAEPHETEEPMAEGEERPPRGAKTMAIVRWVLVVAAATLAGFMWLSYATTRISTAQNGTAKAAPKYQCPMHPEVVSNEPGECPICHMDLELIATDRGGVAEPDADGAAEPSMDAGPDAAPRKAPSMVGTTPGNIPPGTTPVKLTLDRIQSIGVRTATAEERALNGGLRVTAIVVPPEQGVSEVHVRTAGFVEAIQVDQTGIAIGAGQTMLSVYSPEALQAQNELLTISRWAGDAGAASASAAARKLELLGMSPVEIDRVATKRETIRAIAVTAPRGGFVTKKNVVLGSYVTPEMLLYEVQDLSTVYVVADVLLADASALRPGVDGRFVPTARPDDAITAKVDLVYPLVNAEARTRRVRMQIRNTASRRYTPGEYGTVDLSVSARSGVAIPRDALVETGNAKYVFVVEKEGRFTPRVVAVSGSDGERVIVVDGLAAGERVVSGATFLIDSESRLQASIAQATPGSDKP
ncbi:MAG: efflux RND transporter periplasmic adaptor subunit [Labilithrix sp.]|nr:efflux RND transporter periplasmic adaptor subunit [Labilithrix sp.]MCW5811563.1 efflux RND transporter periplasmic adaptor subunit [Labilithrix sp.]